MKYMQLNNGTKIPAVGIGVFRVDNVVTQQMVETALASGYRHIDTAMIYGNEEAVGKAIQNSGVARSEIFLTTKLWNDDQRSGKVQEAMDASLQRLGVDYVDLYLVHWPVPKTYVDVWKKMEAVYHAGKAKAIGVSNYQIHHLQDLLGQAEIVPAINQFECYPYLAQEPLVEFCHAHQICPQAWGPLGAGQSDVLKSPVIGAIAQKHQKSPAQVILRWNVQRGVVVIPKSVHQNRQAENLHIFDFDLSNDEVKQITALNQNLRLGADPDNFNF
ncbi:putative oxidoreductase [Saezia sanguinis]|uniref:Putative oxidoreductase n=1 Tax=Saezia sanguinis TaxID=1965230 RepID=A0A433SDA2_9BURK|nr:aldo/keto reductase [Saezia sanguinis]RUS66727.1 putative oxidoreductase [Saezia sanguinis]